ncbi:PREDICTED: BAG family molecular chaperone regulator 7-like [Ipomoea nil]|uniref:BAG family molecular chaperone regulator 7-like n=1 Tax=Ipomoea nil TaxID=35883 RepID=UPI000901CBF0|nr:PREDICTED: BAG family molecular chaperone regulator 7-like [Ipomoea nil]
MSRRFTRFELFEHSPPFFLKETTTLSRNPFYPSFPLENELDIALDLICPTAYSLPRFDFTSQFDAVTDLVQIERTPFYSNVKRVQRRRVGSGFDTHCLQSLCDRVSALELEFDRLSLEKKKKTKVGDRKYTWTAEIKSPEEDGLDRKYKWVAKINDDGRKGAPEKSYKLTAEIKGKGEDKPISRTYTFEASTGDSGEYRMVEKKDKKKEEKKKKKEDGCKRVVEIEEPSDHGAIVLRQAFARRVEKNKGKRKELSLKDAALVIQMGFRAYLIRRSQVLRALRELAIAKTKLRELRTLFNNFSYRRRVARDAEERQRFSEKIIVLLLTVDAIEGADILVRATKKSMVDELEAMIDVVDPQPGGRSLSMKRRTFDMPDGSIQKELAAGVAKVVQMLDEE